MYWRKQSDAKQPIQVHLEEQPLKWSWWWADWKLVRWMC